MSPDPLPALRCASVSLDHGAFRAVHDVSFSLSHGSVLALVGPNGAGKTTLLAGLCGLHPLSSGTVSYGPHDLSLHAPAIRRRSGVLVDTFGLYPSMQVHHVLEWAAASRGIPLSRAPEAASRTADRCGLKPYYTVPCGTLSRGWRQWLGVAMALVHNPSTLLLDEPASGLDPEARLLLGKLLRTAADDGAAVLVSSHVLTELDRYADSLLVLRDGACAGYTTGVVPAEGALERFYFDALGIDPESSP